MYNKSYSMELVVVRNESCYIGDDKNNLLYHIKPDMKHFRTLTKGHVLLMGRNTFESLPNGPLPNRIHIVLTRNVDTHVTSDGTVYFSDLEHYEELFIRIRKPAQKLFVIGGGMIYDLLWKQCNVLHITHVCDNKVGNVKWDTPYHEIEEEFDKVKSLSQHCEDTELDYIFIEYRKKCVV